ncbi:TonB-dependent receptor [Hyphomicrobium sp. LHD-15]|uniref:TonB-dependent receptor n=1 Tax=Hyphomicrobium sp. LHD-15 TaxID=3072142 RepID=UPI00280E3BC3|nr:TonB-dependent receptor [Hyphomicrobium sp. LHD-15]MDQ8697105.1 TonB-dependent receptor [Hyphomicrobium sp. LHD-15]
MSFVFLPKAPVQKNAAAVRCSVAALALYSVSSIAPAFAQETQLDPFVISATRKSESLSSLSSSVTVVTREEIEKQVSLSNNDLASALGKLVPGLAVGNQTMSTYGQTLRGRKPIILVDGVQQNPAFDPGKNFWVIDPSLIERIEVVRGTTAIFGDGATGGLINIITKKPTDGAPVNTTTVGTNFALSSLEEDGFSKSVSHTTTGKSGAFGYVFGASYVDTGAFFDADGDRIAPNPHRDGGISDTEQWDFFSKTSIDIDKLQTAQLTLNAFQNLQDTNWIGDPSQHEVYNGEKGRVVNGASFDDPVGVRNLAATFDYNHQDVFGSALHFQAFYKDYWARSTPFFGFSPITYQDRIESEKAGGRIEIDTPISSQASVLWGADYLHEDIQQNVREMDAATVTSSGRRVFRYTGNEYGWLNPYAQDSIAAFAQGEWRPFEKLTLRAGVRHEETFIDVPTFTVLGSNTVVDGGKLDFSATLFNAGAVYDLTQSLNVFANFSQGFSLPDVRQVLRRGRAGPTSTPFSDVDGLVIEPELVDNYEIGARGNWDRISGSISLFYNESDLGANPPLNVNSGIVRAPEKIWGVEVTTDVRATDTLTFGGTFTWLEGKQDLETDTFGWLYLNNQRIRPPKGTAYIEHQTTPWMKNRIQMLASGHRDRFNGSTASFKREIDGYVVFDWMSEIKIGEDTLMLGVENIFNRLYYTPQSQQFLEGDVTHAAAQGATFSARYTHKW